ncbi:DUF1039 domain-containing protein [Pandoraea oxalativorans]|uniref:EscG/YscG/SsaH family type III secretion system needle protein co-chaperone n=1 Tax=Pandoraea oxalativorans TaxID=573737 RepID=A0A0G3IID9_9BURK|nr:DUF1039 domain-containing protein [Pandoraea oxalativorans]AKK24875.1 hypothetical protein MB84_29355 [Pandoraea oxalativorans]
MSPPSFPRLIVELSFAAVSQRLRPEVKEILAALPDWIDDPQQLARCEAMLLYSLGRYRAAAKRLAKLSADDCVQLRGLVLMKTQQMPNSLTPPESCS